MEITKRAKLSTRDTIRVVDWLRSHQEELAKSPEPKTSLAARISKELDVFITERTLENLCEATGIDNIFAAGKTSPFKHLLNRVEKLEIEVLKMKAWGY